MQKKRKTGSKRYKQKIKRRRIFLLSVFVAVLILCVCLFTPVFGISEITVSGNLVVPSEEIISVSGIETGENVFRISAKKAKSALSEIAYVENANIKRKFPAKIVIEIEEAKQDLIYDTLTEFVVTDINGRVLEKTDDVTEISAPIIYGIEISDAIPAKKIEATDSEALAVDAENISCFYDTSFWSDIDVFDVSNRSNLSMTMKSGMKVTFGVVDNTENLRRKIKMMEQILPQVKQTDKSYLDLTTDKGYFGEYTEDEIEEMKQREESGESILSKVKKEKENEDKDKEQEESAKEKDKKEDKKQ